MERGEERGVLAWEQKGLVTLDGARAFQGTGKLWLNQKGAFSSLAQPGLWNILFGSFRLCQVLGSAATEMFMKVTFVQQV